MGIGALLHTKSAQAWFGDMLKQSPIVIRLNGFGLTVAAIVVLLNLLQPTLVNQTALMWALIGLGIAQVVSLVMQIVHQAARSALAGPIVLLALIGAFLVFTDRFLTRPLTFAARLCFRSALATLRHRPL